jgi:hypothetical protein
MFKPAKRRPDNALKFIGGNLSHHRAMRRIYRASVAGTLATLGAKLTKAHNEAAAAFARLMPAIQEMARRN